MRDSRSTRVRVATALAAVALFFSTSDARAQLVLNGDFSNPGTPGQLTVNTSLANWTGIGKEGNFGSPTTPPVFVFPTTGGSVAGSAFMGSVSFFGNPQGPSGQRFVAADGDPDWAGGIQQTINGLTPGDSYDLNFNWAGAQQTGFSGDTTQKWQVTFGSQTQSTATVNTPSQSFVGWQSATLNFTATSSSQLLTFLAVGTPGGQPPWLLLNNVQMTPQLAVIPEPSSIAIATFVGLCFIGNGIRARRRKLKQYPA